MAETTPSPSSSTWEQGEQVNVNSSNMSLGKGDDDEKNGQEAAASASSVAMAASMAEDLQRTVMQSTDSAIRSARSLQHHLPQYVEKAVSDYRTYENAFFTKIKEGLMSAREHPASTLGIGLTAAFLLLPGPRRFFIRQTFSRLQSEEAQFVRAEKNVKELNLSVDLMKKESKKLLERALLAEKDMKYGQTDLMDVGSQIQSLSKSVHKVESQAADLMDGLREIPNREALKLRAEASCFNGISFEKAEVCAGQTDNEDLGTRTSSVTARRD
ncbi:unnamed protein product [Prunus armeniaca]|uniref:Uncharacterized protein n=1 Tax=Prunus armeniaca TaxID=36596 RepID=A0A6J5V1M2_PRUAR|nr:hypothetical protein GBA52_021914 [Prunus armeniaca]CAB4282172.1 unnamed protein product [Prunus armeniaca]